MIRLASVSPRFNTGGFDLVRSWTTFESLTTEQRETLIERHGRWIRVHPDDRPALAKIGLRFVSGQEPLEIVHEAEKADEKNKNDNNKTKAEKADGKKG